MLMDLFFKEVSFEKKKRVHFHEYMIDVHHRLFQMQKADANRMSKCDTKWTAASAEAQRLSVTHNASSTSSSDLVERVADSLMSEARLLCFDEFQVTNISDAVIMRRLFSIMFSRGVVVVATSNRSPDDLYLNGLNRELFVPFIPLLKQHCVVHCMDSETDHRQLTSGSDLDAYKVYFPISQAAVMEAKFFHSAQNDIDYDAVSIEVQGRSVSIRRVAKNSAIAWFTFKELCDKPLGSADYISIAKRFHTVYIEHVPKLTLQERDQVRRFITLIDALYDNGTKLVVSAEAILIMDIFKVSTAEKAASAVDEIFAWDRTVSRLTEMTSVEYLIRHIRRLSYQEFFGQYDLDAGSLSDSDLRQIFVRYDKNNDSIIAVAGLNRMVADIDRYVSGNSTGRLASHWVTDQLSKDGRRVHFAAFKAFVDTYGLVSGLFK
jgi:predicted ATPase